MCHIYLSQKSQRDSEGEIVIEYYQLNKDFFEVRNLIAHYASKYDFVDLGNERKPT
jgi:hypothetical protein